MALAAPRRVLYHVHSGRLALPHVLALVESFVDGSRRFTLDGAAVTGSRRLFARVWERVRGDLSAANALLLQHRLARAVEAALRHGTLIELDLEATALRGPMATEVRFSARLLSAAAEGGSIPAMAWVLSLLRPWRPAAADIDAETDAGTMPVTTAVYDPEALWPEVVRRASRAGRHGLIRWLWDEGHLRLHHFQREGAFVTADAAERGDMAFLAWRRGLADGGGGIEASDVPEDDATRGADTDPPTRGFPETALWSAVRSGRVEVVRYVHANLRPQSGSISVLGPALNAAILAQDEPIIAYLEEVAVARPTPQLLGSAGAHGRWDLLQCPLPFAVPAWRGNEWFEGPTMRMAVNGACQAGRLEVLKVVNELYGARCSAFAIGNAARNGHLGVLEWVHADARRGDWDATILLAAAGNGQLAVVQWLTVNRPEGTTTAAMDQAAAGGHLACVVWLHTHRTEGCTTTAMDQAAAHGHLDVVRFLHEHRTEGCTTLAMDVAARHGRLEVVQWLHAHRLEGCTAKAMDEAAIYGHLEVVVWLHEHRHEGCTTRAFDESQEDEIVEWLHAHRPEGGTGIALERAALRGNLRQMDFVYAHGHDRPVDRQCVRLAMMSGLLLVLQWLHDKFPELLDPPTPLPGESMEHHPQVVAWFNALRARPLSTAPSSGSVNEQRT